MTGDIAILMYHSISSIGGRLREFGVPPKLLREHLTILLDAGYTLVGQSEALDRQAVRDPRPAVALTFDDGYANFLTSGLDILTDVNATATLYMPAGHVGQDRAPWLGKEAEQFGRLLTGPELREIAEAGIEIGNHGLIHHPLDVLSDQRVDSEIRDSHRCLSDLVARPIRSFSYPHGYHDFRVRAAVARHGHDNACEVGRARCHPTDDRLAVPRLAVTSDHRGKDVLSLVESARRTPMTALRQTARPAWRVARRLAFQGFGLHLT